MYLLTVDDERINARTARGGRDVQTIGVFKDPNAISCITGQFREAGLDHTALSLIVRDREEPGETKPDTVVQLPKVMKGGLIGGLAGLIVGAATLLVPGIGLIVVGGPLASALGAIVAALSGAATGATVGALVSLIGDIGVPEKQAQEYASLIRQGDGLVIFEHDGSRDVEAIFRSCGCRDVRSYSR